MQIFAMRIYGGGVKRAWRDVRGVSLIETLIASAIFILFVTSLGVMGFSGVDLTRAGGERLDVVRYAEEGIEAVRAIRGESYTGLTPGIHGIATTSTGWVFSGVEDRRYDMIRYAEVTTLGAGRSRVDVHVRRINGSTANEVIESTFVHDLFGSSWVQTSEADFNSGRNNGTEVLSDVGDGAVSLRVLGDFAAMKIHVTQDLGNSVEVRTLRESGGRLFVGSTVNGEELVVYDISNMTGGIMPRIFSTNIGDVVNGIAVSGAYAYVATPANGGELMVVRISDGSVVRSLDLPGTADGLSLMATGTTLYLGRMTSTQPELYEINIADPLAGLPILRTLQISGNINGLAFGPSGHLLGASSGIEIFAVNIGTFTTAASLDITGGADARSLAVFGNTLYVARGGSTQNELIAIDVANPGGGMVITGGVQLASSAYDVSVGADGTVAVVTGAANLEVALFAPGTLMQIGTMNISSASGARAVLMLGSYIYTGMSSGDPEIVVLRGNTGSWDAPVLTGGYNVSGNSDGRAVWVVGDRAYLGTANNGSGQEFFVLDLTDPSAPVRLGSTEIGGNVNDITVIGSYAYLATAQSTRELTVVDIANPGTPAIVGSYNITGSIAANSLIASGTTLFLGTAQNNAGGGRELYAFNVSTPSLPLLLGGFEVNANVNALAQKRNWILLATGNNAKELIVVDVVNPGVMSEIASYDTPFTGDALAIAWTEAAGGFLVLGTEDNGAGSDYFQFTLAPNGAPLMASFLNLAEDNTGIGISGGVGFVTNDRSGGGLTILNVENPASPQLLNVFSLGGVGNAVFPGASTVYVANSANSQEFSIVRPAVVPTILPREGWFTSVPFDSGRDVEPLALSWTTSGTGTVKFQLRSASTLSGLTSAMWVGPTGTNATAYGVPGEAIVLDPARSGARWFEYRATLLGDSIWTPILEDVRMTYN